MNATLQVTSVDLAGVERKLEDAKGYVQQRMADAFLDCVFANIGGSERFVRRPFKALSPSYAAKVGRSYATLEVSGKLKASIGTGISESGAATVESSGVVYAAAHQYGNDRLPARPFFPMDDDGTILPEVVDLVNDRAREELAKILST